MQVIAAATTAAVSVRKRLAPNATALNPEDNAKPISISVKSPSGPMSMRDVAPLG